MKYEKPLLIDMYEQAEKGYGDRFCQPSGSSNLLGCSDGNGAGSCNHGYDWANIG